jgi:tRNA modification GTPase
LQLVLDQGIRLALPGEFTKRAFLNGRIDLVQAEAVIDIIRGKTDAALHLAQHQREGLLSAEFAQIKNSLSHALALVEAYVDFPEEDLGTASVDQITTLVGGVRMRIQALLDSYAEGKVLRDGVSVLIAGKPNVGKSSLLNILLKEQRAIVTSIPGTTRDIIEEVVNVHGLPVRLLDTAGIRESEDPVEREGVRLVLERIPAADLVLFLVDGSRPLDDEDLQVASALAADKCLLVQTKSDLPDALAFPADWQFGAPLLISSATGDGIELLKRAIADKFFSGHVIDSREYVAVSNARHRDSLVKAAAALLSASAQLADSLQLELLAVDLRESLAAIGEISGETTPDDILDLIFSQFCIGK